MFTLGNVLYFGGIAFLAIGGVNLIQCYGQSIKRIIVYLTFVILGLAGFWFGDDMRRKEIFTYTIDHYQDGFSSGGVQVTFKEETTPRMIKANMVEKFKEKAAEDGNPDTIEMTRADKKEYFE